MKLRHTTELPGSIKEIFDYKEVEYRMDQDYQEPDMDNAQALNWFMEEFGLKGDFVFEHNGTQAVIQHPDFDYKLVIDSGGGGDTHSHRFAVSMFES